MCASVYDMSWWGSWFGLLVGGTLIWHALTGTVLPSYSTDSHCPGNRSSSSRTQSTHGFVNKIHTHTHAHTLTQTYTHPSRGSVLSDLALGLVGTDGWTVGVWAAITRKSKGTHAQVHTLSHTHTGTYTQRITGSPRLGQKVANIQTDRLKCTQRSLPRSVSHTDTRTHSHSQGHIRQLSHSHTHAYLLVNTHLDSNMAFDSHTQTHTRTHTHTQDY